jgi:2-oxoglutarate ferredoxin oxidoreductase subunit beta
MTDDGFNIGILYRGDRQPYRPPVGEAMIDVAELERDLEL